MSSIFNSISIIIVSAGLVACMYFINKRLRKLEDNDIEKKLERYLHKDNYHSDIMWMGNLRNKQEQQGILIEELTYEIKRLESTVLDYKIQVKQLEVKIK